jgi:hypothetical protein
LKRRSRGKVECCWDEYEEIPGKGGKPDQLVEIYCHEYGVTNPNPNDPPETFLLPKTGTRFLNA